MISANDLVTFGGGFWTYRVKSVDNTYAILDMKTATNSRGNKNPLNDELVMAVTLDQLTKLY